MASTAYHKYPYLCCFSAIMASKFHYPSADGTARPARMPRRCHHRAPRCPACLSRWVSSDTSLVVQRSNIDQNWSRRSGQPPCLITANLSSTPSPAGRRDSYRRRMWRQRAQRQNLVDDDGVAYVIHFEYLTQGWCRVCNPPEM